MRATPLSPMCYLVESENDIVAFMESDEHMLRWAYQTRALRIFAVTETEAYEVTHHFTTEGLPRGLVRLRFRQLAGVDSADDCVTTHDGLSWS